MGVSSLLGKIKGGEKVEKPKAFLALEITDEVVVAAVWHVKDNKTEVVSTGTPVEWNGDKSDKDELVKAADATISAATEGIGDDISEIIFGVAPSWAGDDGILKDKLQLIKTICQELELKPLGFVVITDSLLRYLKMQEGTPSTSILVQIARDTITVTLVRFGNIVQSESLGRGEDVAQDVEEGISRFGEVELPSRIILFDGMHNIEEEVQNLTSYDWKGKFNFLHIPKVESLPRDVLIKSIAVAGGMEVARAIGFEVVEPEPEPEHELESDPEPIEDLQEDILSAEEMGFGVAKKLPPQKPHPSAEKIDLAGHQDEVKEERSSKAKAMLSSLALPKFKLRSLTLPKLSFLKNIPKPFLFGGAFLAIILIIALGAVWLIPKAKVTIYVEPKDLSENIELVLSTQVSQIDVVNSTIPSSVTELEVTGQDSLTTTGTKTIGDPAKGEVTVYNRTSLSKTFEKGTVISKGSLKFTLDDPVTVASKSAGADYVDVPGKANVKVTASAIGETSNLGEDTEFAVENFSTSSYVARNDNAFAGGTSEEIQVVSKEDKSDLEDTLFRKLREEGKSQLLGKLGSSTGVYIQEEGSEIKDVDYSADVGEEASALTGDMTVLVRAFTYSLQDVEELMRTTIESTIPEGYTKTEAVPEVELGEVKKEGDNEVEIEAKITVDLLPKLDTASVANTLKGLGGGDVEAALSTITGLTGAQVEITPLWLPPRFKRMPKNPVNITVKILPSL